MDIKERPTPTWMKCNVCGNRAVVVVISPPMDGDNNPKLSLRCEGHVEPGDLVADPYAYNDPLMEPCDSCGLGHEPAAVVDDDGNEDESASICRWCADDLDITLAKRPY